MAACFRHHPNLCSQELLLFLRLGWPCHLVLFSFPPAHSLHGTGADLKLPNFTEDANWHGLAQLYSVNESLFEHRHDYSPSLEDWANFAKDVDSMFALLSNLKKLNQSEMLEPWADMGSGARALEEASGDGVSEQVDWHLVLTSEPQNPTLMTPLTPQWTCKSANELPERLPTKPLDHASNQREDLHPQNLQKELDRDDLSFSGNGLTELETHHEFVFSSSALEAARDLSRVQGEKGGHFTENKEEVDIFEAQIYLPARLPSQAVEATPFRPPLQNLHMPHAQVPHDSQDSEGSGLPISPSSTSLWQNKKDPNAQRH